MIVKNILILILIILMILNEIKSKKLSINELNDLNKNHKYLFVLFYSSKSCKRCAEILPDWKSFENRFADNNLFNNEVNIVHIDCDVYRDFCSYENIQELPSAKLYIKINTTKRIIMDYNSKEYDRNTLDMFLLKQITVFGFDDQKSKQKHYNDKDDDDDDGNFNSNEKESTSMIKAYEGLYELTDDDASLFLRYGQHFVNFYAPWCSHCQNLKPKWEMIAKSLEHNEQVKISQINCQENVITCKKQFKIKEYPTLLWIVGGKIIERYKGSHEINQIKSFINSQLTDFELDRILKKYSSNPNSGIDDIMEIDYRNRKNSNVMQLNVDNFKLTTDNGWTFVHFTVPWSKHCRQMKNEWDKFSISATKSTTTTTTTNQLIKIAKIDCSINEKICTQEKIDSYPTLLLYYNGNRQSEYVDNVRTSDSFMKYFQQQQQQTIMEPVVKTEL